MIESSESFVLSHPRSTHDLGVCRGRFWREYPNNHSLECTNWDGIVYWHAAAFLASLFPLTRNLLNKICKSLIHALDVTIDLANVLYVLPCFFFVLSKLLSFSSPNARRTIGRARHDQIPNKSPFCRLGGNRRKAESERVHRHPSMVPDDGTMSQTSRQERKKIKCMRATNRPAFTSSESPVRGEKSIANVHGGADGGREGRHPCPIVIMVTVAASRED